jgi:hypothetical protein
MFVTNTGNYVRAANNPRDYEILPLPTALCKMMATNGEA